MNDWTRPYCGVTHLGEKAGPSSWWVTVTDRGSFAELSCWFPGCGFSPLKSTHDTVEQAKTAGEKWLKKNVKTEVAR